MKRVNSIGLTLQSAFLVMLTTLILFPSNGQSEEEPGLSVGAKLWAEAATSYREGEFDRAAEIYEELALAEPRNIPVLKNLALCYARLNQNPRALLLLRQLKAYGAGGREIAQDIALLRQRLSLDGPEPVEAWEAVTLRFGLNPRMWFAGSNPFLFYIGAGFLLIGSVLVTAARIKKRRTLYQAGFVFGIIGVGLGIFVVSQAMIENETSEATILFGTPAWSGPDKENFQPISRFDSGEIVRVMSPQTEAGFARIALGDGKIGFIPVNLIGLHEIGFMDDAPPFNPIFLADDEGEAAPAPDSEGSDSDGGSLNADPPTEE